MISSSFNREVLNSVDSTNNGILSGLVKGLQNLTKGEKRSIFLTAEEAYGLYDPKKVILFPRKKLPRFIRQGEQVTIEHKNGLQRTYRVVELFADFANLDGNHPLAGQDLLFEIEALEAREATAQEIDDSLNVVASQLLH